MDPKADRVPLSEVRDLLRIGHALPFRVLDANARLLLNAGHLLADENQFEALVERGAWAERPLVEAERAAQAAAAGKPAPQAPAVSLFDRWERRLWEFDKLSRALVRGAAVKAALAGYFASVRELIDLDADVALFLCIRPGERRFALYPLTHAIHCSVLAVLAARQLGWPAARVESLGCAALTMNLAALELQAVMAEQDTPPTGKQMASIRAHPEASARLLRAAGVADETWLEAVVQHHEHPGGGGYPHELLEVAEAAQVLRAADVYMAKLSPRAGRPPMAPQLAVRQLFQQRPGDPLAMAFIKTVGIYPPGSLVQLHSGEIGVVTHRPASGTHPLVATLSDRHGRPVLQTFHRDTAQAEFAVQGAPADASAFPRVLPERVYGLVAGTAAAGG